MTRNSPGVRLIGRRALLLHASRGRSSQLGPAVLLILTVGMLATGRWGSYIQAPGLPIYIGDVLLLVAVITFVVSGGLRSETLATLRTAPWALRFTLLLLLWSVARFATRLQISLVDLRDLAPYAYAITAALAFMMPLEARPWTSRLIYSALTFHAAWFIADAVGWIDDTRTPRLGPSGVGLFTTRPDFDAAVFAIAVGLALHALLLTHRRPRPIATALLVLFLGVNAWAVTLQHTRAGLLATVVVVAVVTVAWVVYRSKRLRHAGSLVRWGPPTIAAGMGVAICALALTFTLPGQRLLNGINGTQGESAGTSNARAYVYENLSEYILEDPIRTSVGVGFGPDFLKASGTLDILEGTTYKNVRSPHNYVLGTWARLGAIGALSAVLILTFGAWMGMRHLWQTDDTVAVLAALALIALPVPAMLGVILESPFGALPYFWALGTLSAHQMKLRAQQPGRGVLHDKP